jgi:phage shock protein C
MSGEKRLTKSESNKVFLGVCGGLAEYFEVDPVIVRVIFVLLALGNGFGVILYLILAIALPSENEIGDTKGKERIKKVVEDAKNSANSLASELRENSKASEHLKNLRIFGGIILVFVGLVALLGQFFNLHILQQAILPVLVILLGAYLIFKK